MNAGHSVDLDALKAALSGTALEELATRELGEPNRARSSRSEWRWGENGSASLVIRGPKRGLFYTHEGRTGGGALDLIMHARQCAIGEAIRIGSEWLGGTITPISAVEREGRERKREAAEAEARAERASKIAKAQRSAARTVPLRDDHPGGIYLPTTRHIPRRAEAWPDAVRWDEATRALALIASTASGEVRALQYIYLTEDGQKIGEEEQRRRRLPNSKITHGVLDGAAVRLPGPADGPLLVAEGPETGLSLWASTGYETWIALGSIGKMEVPHERRIIACRDDDRRNSPADMAFRKTVAGWRFHNRHVVIASPWAEAKGNGSDFNDLIAEGGPEAVRARIAVALGQQGRANPHRISVAEARRLLPARMARFFREVKGWTPPVDGDEPPPLVLGIRGSVGVGKSRTAYRYAAELLAYMRAHGDMRSGAVLVPMLILGDQQADIFNAQPETTAAGLTARVWRGMERPDPTHSDFHDKSVPDEKKTRMCRDLEAVKDARDAGARDIQSTVCRGKGPDGEAVACPFFGVCGVQRQRQQRADLWIGAHELKGHKPPKAFGDLAFVIIDESCWATGLEGASGHHITLSLDTLAQHDRMPGAADDATLRHARALTYDALHGLTDGPVSLDAMEAVGMTAALAAEARAIEWGRKVDPRIWPGMPVEERRAAVRAAAINRTIRRLGMFWRGIEKLMTDRPEASGWVAVATEETKDGPVRVLHLKGHRPVAKGWRVPTLLMDAHLNPNLLADDYPTLEVIADLDVAAPHQRVRQVVDNAFALSRLELLTAEEAEADPDEAKRRMRRLREVHAIIAREARRCFPERVLAVLQKAVKEGLAAFRPLPPNVELAHHNSVAGRDEWGPAEGRPGVRLLIVVGRTQAPPAAVARLAEARSGRAVAPLPGNGWYPRVDATREMTDGTWQPAEAERHPDPLAEEIRWEACVGELVQIIGRGRGVNRTEANPLDVLVLTDVPLPLPIAETITADEIAPTLDDELLAKGGITFESGRHATAYYPGRWTGRDPAGAAREAFAADRRRSARFPYSRVSIGESCAPPDPGLALVRYKLAGAGQKEWSAWADLSVLPDLAARLAEKLGPLAWPPKVEAQPAAPEPSQPPAPPVEPPPAPEPTPEPPAPPRPRQPFRAPPAPPPSIRASGGFGALRAAGTLAHAPTRSARRALDDDDAPPWLTDPDDPGWAPPPWMDAHAGEGAYA